METGETDQVIETKVAPFGLLLRWDGFEVQWAWMSKKNEVVNYTFGAREVTQPSMLPEVIRALKSRYKALETVVYSRRYSPVTMLPAVVLQDSEESASMWFNFHNAVALDASGSVHHSLLRQQHLESVEGEPVFIEKTDENWEFAVIKSFPQARGVINRAAFMKIAVADSRNKLGKWVVRVDVGKRGADFVAAFGGKAIWSGYSEGGDVEGMLYNIVNVMHRDGKGPKDLIVRISGSGAVELKSSLSRFFTEIHLCDDTKWEGLKSLSL